MLPAFTQYYHLIQMLSAMHHLTCLCGQKNMSAWTWLQETWYTYKIISGWQSKAITAPFWTNLVNLAQYKFLHNNTTLIAMEPFGKMFLIIQYFVSKT